MSHSQNVENLLQDRYSETFQLWLYTPKWRVIARWRRKVIWKDWLRTMHLTIKDRITREKEL